jgi:FtsP/CotA-like multicopper oxidase with cupredoxin domain
MPKRRNIYLKIERLPAYSPVAPDDAEHDRYRLDCMSNMGHEDATIPNAEVERRRIDALVYREYLDPAYTVPNTEPLIAADVNEPRFDRRIPGALIYTEPGERLFVHVLNADDAPHSMHVHGLVYGVDSDGSWPLGVHSHDDRRSDEICPGQKWCYVFDVTEETVGAWPFHDHHMDIVEQVNRGLFGGIVVRDRKGPKPDYEVPFFFHRLAGVSRATLFDSGTLNRTDPPFSFAFLTEGTYEYYCRFHPMRGTVRVSAAGDLAASVSILDGPPRRPCCW